MPKVLKDTTSFYFSADCFNSIFTNGINVYSNFVENLRIYDFNSIE